jgi:NAD(P)-dependent dehydrogenase (short-subunit alcohol dehydrogenase family)
VNNQPVVMITGAAGGLGSELVRAFSEEGYRVLATARTIPEKSEARVAWHQLDVTEYIQCKEAVAVAFDKFGRIDVLISNASGYTGGKTIAEMSEADIDTELAVTLRASIYLSKLYVELARAQRSGKIIFISSIAGLPGEPECKLHSVYSAAKAGLIRFAECLHEDIQSFGMQAHVVVPCSMRAELDKSALVAQKAIAYDAAARFVANIAKTDGNVAVTSSILRTAKTPM